MPSEADVFTNVQEVASRSVDSQTAELSADEDGRALLAGSARKAMERNIPVAFGLLWVVLSGMVLFLRVWPK